MIRLLALIFGADEARLLNALALIEDEFGGLFPLWLALVLLLCGFWLLVALGAMF